MKSDLLRLLFLKYQTASLEGKLVEGTKEFEEFKKDCKEFVRKVHNRKEE